MAATKAITALGTVVTFDTVTLGEIMSCSGTRSRRIKEVLSVDSDDSCVEKLGGALDEGTVTFHMIYDGSSAGAYDSLNTKFQTDPPAAAATLLITLIDTSSFSVNALMTDLSLPGWGEGDGTLECDITFALSGKITYTDVA